MDKIVNKNESDKELNEVDSQDFSTPSDLLQGVDSFMGKRKNSPVEGTAKEAESLTIIKYKLTTSIKEFSDSIDISSSLTFESLFGVFSVDAKVKFANSLKITDNSVAVLVYYRHSKLQYADDTKLKTGITPPPVPVDNKKLLDFFDNYGDQYVTEITKGGEYIAAFVFHSTSISEKQNIIVELNAKGVAGGGEISTENLTSIESVIEKSSVDVTFNQTLIGYSGVVMPTDYKDIPKFISETLPKQQMPDETISYKTACYYEVPQFTRDMLTPITDNYALFVEQIIPVTEKLASIVSDSNLIKNTYKHYGYTLDTALDTTLSSAKTAIQSLSQISKSMSKDPTSALPTLPDTSVADEGLPQIEMGNPVAGVKIAGGSGGSEFTDLNRRNIINCMIFFGAAYKEDCGFLIELSNKYGIVEKHGIKNSISHKHGSGSGDIGWQSINDIPYNKFITKMVGHTNNSRAAKVDIWITGDNHEQPASRSLGSSTGSNLVTWKAHSDSCTKTYEVFVGWAGFSGGHIDNLIPLTVKFEPSTRQVIE